MRQSGYVKSDGYQIYFERFGEGPPMILVHGWGADTRSNWVDTGWIEVLREVRSIISIDARGHGKSDKPHALGPYSYAAMSRDVVAVMDTLKIDKADFMGYSMGSFMGAYLLGHHPDRFTSMILGGIGDETELSAAQGSVIAEALRAPDLSSIDSPIGKSVRTYLEVNPANDLESLAYSAAKMWPEGYPVKLAGPNIGNARFPVLIVNGEQDHPYVDSADQLAEALPDGTHLRIPGTDHMSTVTDDRFKKAVIDFLTSEVVGPEK
jgi:pimeloyl-ACP methyl ester carboxylesterase